MRCRYIFRNVDIAVGTISSFLFLFIFKDDTRCLKLSLPLYVVDRDTGWDQVLVVIVMLFLGLYIFAEKLSIAGVA